MWCASTLPRPTLGNIYLMLRHRVIPCIYPYSLRVEFLLKIRQSGALLKAAAGQVPTLNITVSYVLLQCAV